MFAHDQGWLRRMREAVTSGLTAEAAVERVQSDNRARMLRQTDPYLRERLHDLDDLANRLLHRLVGRDFVTERENLPEKVEPNKTYRDVHVRWGAAAKLKPPDRDD